MTIAGAVPDKDVAQDQAAPNPNQETPKRQLIDPDDITIGDLQGDWLHSEESWLDEAPIGGAPASQITDALDNTKIQPVPTKAVNQTEIVELTTKAIRLNELMTVHDIALKLKEENPDSIKYAKSFEKAAFKVTDFFKEQFDQGLSDKKVKKIIAIQKTLIILG